MILQSIVHTNVKLLLSSVVEKKILPSTVNSNVKYILLSTVESIDKMKLSSTLYSNVKINVAIYCRQLYRHNIPIYWWKENNIAILCGIDIMTVTLLSTADSNNGVKLLSTVDNIDNIICFSMLKTMTRQYYYLL